MRWRVGGSLDCVSWLGLLLIAFILGCERTAGEEVTIPMLASGSEESSFESEDAWQVELRRAELAVGPFWACSTELASTEFCPAAIAELRTTSTFDALSAQSQMLGMLDARSGLVRTAMWDMGISWLPTRGAPRSETGLLDGHSAIFEGNASHGDGRRFSFRLALDWQPGIRGATTISGRSVGPHEIVDANDALTLRYRIVSWWQLVAFEPIWQDLESASNGADETFEIAPSSRAYSTLLRAMQSSSQPAIEWARP